MRVRVPLPPPTVLFSDPPEDWVFQRGVAQTAYTSTNAFVSGIASSDGSRTSVWDGGSLKRMARGPGGKAEDCNPSESSSTLDRASIHWLDTGWGCGAIRIRQGVVVPGGAPIFRSLIGATVRHLEMVGYRIIPLPSSIPLRRRLTGKDGRL